uniref:TRAF-type domain-containing protein n=1 Tax=Panagrolaimus superbus TaxID=310955 RepID=A0A914YVD6_9BILA
MWDYEPCDDDRGYGLSIDEIKDAHNEHGHCAFCFDLNCIEDDICKIVPCNYCKIKLHSCKVEDHQSICTKASSPCINANFGCPEILRNELRGIHLSKCPASAVVCNLQWNREIIGKLAKRRMKQVSRGFKTQMLEGKLKENDIDELDVFAALDDQREIMESYRTFRHSRVRQRMACTPANPVLPLRYYDKMPIFPEEDSSDEEKFKEEQERMKKKQPFADCYICKLEPGMQHLHVLGNMYAKKDGTTGEIVATVPDLDSNLKLVVPKFYQKRNLFVKLSEARMSDFHRKAFQYRWTREMHTFTCTAVMRRDEISNHWKYHTDVLQLIDGGIIKRCPSAPNGCDFYVRQLIPKNGGRIR